MDREVRLVRRELKFIIPQSLVEPIVDYISVYCDPDPYSKNGDYYRVNSLYLDSRDFSLLSNKKNKLFKRYNLRVRSYGEGTSAPYFFEMKCKLGNLVDKLRSKTNDPNWSQYFDYSSDIRNMNPSHLENCQAFFREASFLNAEPKILTQYDRLAFFSTIDDYARVTFDRNLRYQESSEFKVAPTPGKMSNYDVGSAFGGDQSSVVLELKAGKAIPIWMADLIRIFNLNLRSFSKYERSLECYYFLEQEELFQSIPTLAFA